MKKILILVLCMLLLNSKALAKSIYEYGFDIIPVFDNGSIFPKIINLNEESSASKNGVVNGDIIILVNELETKNVDYMDTFATLYKKNEAQIKLKKSPDNVLTIYKDTRLVKNKAKSRKLLNKALLIFDKDNIYSKNSIKAKKYIDKAITLEPNDFFLLNSRIIVNRYFIGTDFENNKKDVFDELINDVEKVYTISKNPQYLFELGLIYLTMNDDIQAEKKFEEYVNIYNTNDAKLVAYKKLTQYYMYHSNLERAIECFEKISKLLNNEEKKAFYYRIAQKYKENSNTNDALKYYNKYISYLTNREDKLSIYAEIAKLYSDIAKEYNSSIIWWNKFLAISKTNKEKIIAYINLIDNYDLLDKKAMAIVFAQNIINLESNNYEANLYLFNYYYSQNNNNLAIKYITKLLNINEQTKFYLLRADIYEKNNQFDKALYDIKKVLSTTYSTEEQTMATTMLVQINERKIMNSIKNHKNYIDIPRWNKIAPAEYVYVIGDENKLAEYWATRRAHFYQEANKCINTYKGINLEKCYISLNNDEKKANENYYTALYIEQQNRAREMEYQRQQELLEQQYANQQALMRQYYNQQRALTFQNMASMYAIKTAPQTINVNHSGTINSNYNINLNHTLKHNMYLNGTMRHYNY